MTRKKIAAPDGLTLENKTERTIVFKVNRPLGTAEYKELERRVRAETEKSGMKIVLAPFSVDVERSNMELELLKKYLKIDGDALDDVLAGYMAAAETYLTNSGCKIDYSNKLCEVLVTIIVAKLIENPALLSNLGESAGMTITGMIAQLRMSHTEERPE